MEKRIAIFWFRRDLRLHDNHALDAALSCGLEVLPIFIFDSDILDRLASRHDARVVFIHRQISSLKKKIESMGSSLLVIHGKPLDVFGQLIEGYGAVSHVFANGDEEPLALARDREVEEFLKSKGIELHLFADHVMFGKDEVLKGDGKPYTVFTPYSRRWKERLQENGVKYYHSESKTSHFLKCTAANMPSLQDLGFDDFDFPFPDCRIDHELIRKYGETRDIPAVNGTSRLGVHLRFGTMSIRELVGVSRDLGETFLNELIWRDFFMQIMGHYPYVVNGPFKKQYENIRWRNDEKEFDRWCKGMTGFPIVDAGMRELNETGFMHNRVRMITASFLVKHLLIDWRWGEAWFAEKLLDFELASNNGNWQWAASTGCDAVPYFRIFNPETQQQRFDPKGEYVRKWVPELGTIAYPRPMVDHKMARERALMAYKNL